MLRTRLIHALAAVLAAAAALAACSGLDPELRRQLEATVQAEGDAGPHVGPPVEPGDTGPARFARPLFEGFRMARAMELVSFIDRYYRAPGNEGYEEVLARLDKELRALGFGGSEARLQVEMLTLGDVAAWTPLHAELELLVEGQEPRMLHAMRAPEDVDRVMLPIYAPSCDITAEVALALEDVKKGMVLVTEVPAAQVIPRARSRGAAAVISASLEVFNEDPLGTQRHLDAIQFKKLDPGLDMPTAQISPRSLQLIGAAVEDARKRGAKVRLHFLAETIEERLPLHTLMATIQGGKHPEQAVTMVSHVQEPGACDNATGVASLLEGVRALTELMQAGKVPWPDRTLVFLWGDEFRQTESWIATTKLKPVIGISSDMTGQSWEATRAIALLERPPDPGALKVLTPDAHTPWGAGQVSESEIKPNGLAVIARCAMADVNTLGDGKWITAEHPWEGGSDHDIFIARGVPAVLFWHFTDFAYHTSLDRMQFVDPTEMRRTGVALLSTALAVASAQPGDLDRYLETLKLEATLRCDTARQMGETHIAELWEQWCKTGAREWLMGLCSGQDVKLPLDASQPKK